MSLDDLFGAALTAARQGVVGLENRCKPKSLRRLDKNTVRFLEIYTRSIAERVKYGDVIAADVYLLWLVDEAGKIWLAFEEAFDENDEMFRFVLNRETLSGSMHDLPKPLAKLGHPSLVGGGKARIGGELIFDPDATPPIWYLNNKSGRYGLRADRTVAHLRNVQKLFREHGLEFQIDFRPPGQS